MEKIWFIIINEKEEGPFSILELKCDERITPDTLAWTEGLPEWLPMRKIPELKELFKDEPTEEEKDTIPYTPPPINEDEVLALRKDPPFFNFWMAMALFIIFYLLYLLIK